MALPVRGADIMRGVAGEAASAMGSERMSPPEIASDSNSPSDAPLAERGVAARAHLCAWLSVLPLLGLFASVGIYNRRQRYSPWVGQQALQAALFQVLMFNLLLVVLGLVIPIALVAWQTSMAAATWWWRRC